jgi:hypothetical protein
MHPESIRGHIGSRIRYHDSYFVATFGDYEIKVQRWIVPVRVSCDVLSGYFIWAVGFRRAKSTFY